MTSEMLAKIDRAYDAVNALCVGKREWLMSIPARPDHDPDLIIGDALLAARNEIARLARELEEARERERALREAHERSVGVFRRACEIAEAAIVAGETPETASARLRDAIEADIAEINALVALATPQEEGGAD